MALFISLALTGGDPLFRGPRCEYWAR